MTTERNVTWPTGEPDIFTDELPLWPVVLVESREAFFARAAKIVCDFKEGRRIEAFAHESVEPDEPDELRTSPKSGPAS